MYRTTWADKIAVRLDYLPTLRLALTEPLLRDGVNGIDAVIKVMDTYGLTREHRDLLIELSELMMEATEGDDNSSIAVSVQKSIPTQVKTAFTRRYNQQKHILSVLSSTTPFKKKKRDFDVVEAATTNNEDDLAALLDDEGEEGANENPQEETQNDQNAAREALALVSPFVTVGGSKPRTQGQSKPKSKSKSTSTISKKRSQQ